ncbi:MAG: rRNA pseudouridine synthase [Candidatus Eremiobacteraeota bacterium]|nr:rRNA pseudouridine synthase [Candidatus Eremiobacteraeota bacterium]
MKVRLNKFLAGAGIASRRAVDELIRAGKVAIDGRRAHLGDRVDPDAQRITLNGRRVRPAAAADQITLVLNKPLNVITTLHDEHARRSVADYLPVNQRLFPVGRLDAETTGVLLCTTDGELARFLMHPSSGVEKEYEIVARGSMSEQSARLLRAHDVKRLSEGSLKFSMLLTEGQNRQVRRMCAQQGLKVVHLTRTRFGPVRLGRLLPGATRALHDDERRELEQLRANAANE